MTSGPGAMSNGEFASVRRVVRGRGLSGQQKARRVFRAGRESGACAAAGYLVPGKFTLAPDSVADSAAGLAAEAAGAGLPAGRLLLISFWTSSVMS